MLSTTMDIENFEVAAGFQTALRDAISVESLVSLQFPYGDRLPLL